MREYDLFYMFIYLKFFTISIVYSITMFALVIRTIRIIKTIRTLQNFLDLYRTF